MADLLALGSAGNEVLQLASRLISAGYPVPLTQVFNEDLRTAVIQFQRAKGLVADGIVGPKTQTALTGGSIGKLLRQSDIEWAAEELQCELAAIMAVNQVESRGQGFHASGEPVVLFERHIMRRRMLANGIDVSTVSIAEHNWPELVNKKPGGYKGGKTENYRMKMAGDIHSVSALESASWGQYQILGLHWNRLGYNSAPAFASAMATDERHHLVAFVRFIDTDPGLLSALRDLNWAEFARIYNGKAYRKNRYDEKLATAYQQFRSDYA